MKNISRERCDEYIGVARQNGWQVEGQLEEGEGGTQHYQLLVRTPQVRFSAVKKMFPTAHIEKARNAVALAQYVNKEDTRIETLKLVENRFVTWKEVRDKFFQWYCFNEPEQVKFECDDIEKMKYWDMFIGYSIEEGIECDVIGVNPQYRSCILRYWKSYLRRQFQIETDKIQSAIDVPTVRLA